MFSNNVNISSIKRLLFKKKLITTGKVLLALLFARVIYNQISAHAAEFYFAGIFQSVGAVVAFAVVLLMMLLNWALESKRWQLLIGVFQEVRFQKALRSVLSGISLAIVTPGRIGEYGGRLIHIEQQHRGKALLANAVGSVAQNIINVSIGLMGLIAYGSIFLAMSQSMTVALSVISMLMLVVLLLIYFRLDLVKPFLSKYKKYRVVKYAIEHTSFLSSYDEKSLLKILGVSLIRYIVYFSQYIMLAIICGVTSNPLYAAIGISVIFLIQSGIPLPPMLSVLARSEIAIWVWSVFSVNVLAILTATFLLWIINLMLPAVIGTVLILRHKT